MSDLVCLGDVITLEYGRSLPAAHRRAGNVPVYGSNGITGWHDKALLDGPVIVVGRKGSIGEVQYEPGPAFPIDTTYYAQPRPGVAVDLRYLFYMLRVARLTELNSATGVPGLNREHAYRVPTRLPPLDEQRRIVGLLDRAAEIRRRADAARARARAIIPALFLETFGDPATNPKGWPVITVGEAGDVKLGRQRAPKYQSGKFTRPYIRVANVFENRIDVSDLLSMDFDERDFESYRLSYGEILLNEGQSIDLVGRPAMWRNEIDNCCFQNTLVRFKCDPSKIIPEFALAAFLQMYRVGRLSKIASKTSNVAHLGASRFSKLQMIWPSLALQTAFAELVRRFEMLTQHLDDAAAKADAMAAALSAELFGASGPHPPA